MLVFYSFFTQWMKCQRIQWIYKWEIICFQVRGILSSFEEQGNGFLSGSSGNMAPLQIKEEASPYPFGQLQLLHFFKHSIQSSVCCGVRQLLLWLLKMRTMSLGWLSVAVPWEKLIAYGTWSICNLLIQYGLEYWNNERLQHSLINVSWMYLKCYFPRASWTDGADAAIVVWTNLMLHTWKKDIAKLGQKQQLADFVSLDNGIAQILGELFMEIFCSSI